MEFCEWSFALACCLFTQKGMYTWVFVNIDVKGSGHLVITQNNY